MVSFGGFVRFNDNEQSRTEFFKKVEIIYVGPNNNHNCQLPDLPDPIYGHSTIKTNIGIINCGGSADWDGGHEKCWKLMPNNSWGHFPSMNVGRKHFSMEEANGKLFAVGGVDPGAEGSMEWIYLKNVTSWTKKDLPFKVKRHCMTKFNETHILLTGGDPEEVSNRTFK